MGRVGFLVPLYWSVRGERKIYIMGVNNSNGSMVDYMTSLGLALNCDTDLRGFVYIVPCGIKGAGGPTSLIDEQVGKERVVEVGEVKELLIKQFSETFQCETLSVEDCMKTEILKSCDHCFSDIMSGIMSTRTFLLRSTRLMTSHQAKLSKSALEKR